MGKFFSGRVCIEIFECWCEVGEKKIVVCGVWYNNFCGIDVEILLGCFVCVMGVFGFGKSLFVNDIFVEFL